MVTICVKINRIVMYIISFIIVVALLLLTLSVFKGGKKSIGPEKFLENLGYSYKLIEDKKIFIPKKFGENMQKYNELQKRQGFNLKDYAGKVCIQKKYAITDFDGLKRDKNKKKLNDDYIADLIVFDGFVIGGSICGQLYGSEPKALNSLNIQK